MKKLLFLTCLLFSLSAFNELFAKRINLNETVTDTEGCVWKISGWVDLSVGWSISIEHYDVTISSSCGDDHHFVGIVAPQPYGGLVIRGDFYDLSYSIDTDIDILNEFPVETVQNEITTVQNEITTLDLSYHESYEIIPVQTTNSFSVTPITENNVIVNTRDISTQVIQVQAQNSYSLELVSPTAIQGEVHISQDKSQMPRQFPYLIETIKTNLAY